MKRMNANCRLVPFALVAVLLEPYLALAFTASPNSGRLPGMREASSQRLNGLVMPLRASITAQSGSVQEQVEKLRSKAAAVREEVSKLEAERAQEMSEIAASIFRKFDINQDGKISTSELKAGLEKMLKVELPYGRVAKLMESFDQNQNGVLELGEFVGFEKMVNRLEALTIQEKQVARDALKAVKEEEDRAKAMEAQMDLINDREPTVSDKILSVLPYAFPLLDSLQFGRFLLMQHADSPITGALSVFYALYNSIPFATFIAYFTLSFLSSNLSINRLIRFNMQQAIFLDISLFVPSVIAAVSTFLASSSNGPISATTMELGSDAVFVAMLTAVGYAAASSLLGKSPDKLPFISKAVIDRMPSLDNLDEESLSMLAQLQEKRKSAESDENGD